MFLGSRVDDALTLYYRKGLEHGERLDLDAGQPTPTATSGARDSRQRNRARRGLERHPSARRVRARRAGARADVRAARPQARGAGRGATPARVHARAGAHGVDDRLLPRPRNPQPAHDRRAARPGRRLQGQGQPDRPADRRPRPAGQPVPRRPLARKPARRRVRVRADREARTAAKTDERIAHHHPANAGQLRAALARIALAAREIDAYYRRFGQRSAVGVRRPDQLEVLRALLPAWSACPGGGGLYGALRRGPGTYHTNPPATGATMPNTFAEALPRRHARDGRRCPIEAGLLGRLADHECPHGRLPGDRTPKCGCCRRRTRPSSPSSAGARRTESRPRKAA